MDGNNKMDLESLRSEIVNWIQQAEVRVYWWNFVSTVMNLQDTQMLRVPTTTFLCSLMERAPRVEQQASMTQCDHI